MHILKKMPGLPFMLLLAFAAPAHAELVRCTSPDGGSVIRKDRCDKPDDVRTPVTPKSGTRVAPEAASGASSPTDEAMAAYKGGEFAKARSLFEPLAEKGDPVAQIMMSDLHKNGRGVRPDPVMAYRWARRAGDQGDARGQALVAACMQAGTGTPRDDAGAIAWLEKSANQGYSTAQMGMAAVYMDGRGTKKDEEKAVLWLRKAAAQGDTTAAALLKQMKR